MCIPQNYESYFEDFKMIIERAIQNRHLLAFTYDGFSRTVEGTPRHHCAATCLTHTLLATSRT
jgi:hypothetical protein